MPDKSADNLFKDAEDYTREQHKILIKRHYGEDVVLTGLRDSLSEFIREVHADAVGGQQSRNGSGLTDALYHCVFNCRPNPEEINGMHRQVVEVVRERLFYWFRQQHRTQAVSASGAGDRPSRDR